MAIPRLWYRSSPRMPQWIVFGFGILIGIIFGCTFTFVLTDQRAPYETDVSFHHSTGQSKKSEPDSPVEFIFVPSEQNNSDNDKQEESNDDYVKEILAESADKNNDDSPDWYKLLSKYNPNKKSSESNKNSLLHKKDVLISIFLKTCNELSKISMVSDTWGEMVDIMIFLNPDCKIPQELKHLTIVQLEDLGPYVYPPQKRTFSILKYIWDKNGSSHSWFMIISDIHTYINSRYLQEYVHQKNHDKLYYIGNTIQLSDDKIKEYNLYDHEKFCQSKVGILLSKGLLQKLVPLLDNCLSEYVRNLSTLIDEDIELGRCISRKLNIQCQSDSNEDKKLLFYSDTDNQLVNPSVLFNSQPFNNIISLHPIKTDIQMNVIHFYYSMLEYNITKQTIVLLGESVALSCQRISSQFENSKEIQPILKYCNIDVNEDLVKLANEIAPGDLVTRKKLRAQGWDYFDSGFIYVDDSIEPRKPISKYVFELESVLLEVERIANVEFNSHLEFKSLINGYVRRNGIKGNEYIIDAEFVDLDKSKATIQRRFSLLKQLTPNFILQSSKHTVDEMVTFLVPISHVTDRLDEFLKMYEKLALAKKENTKLVIVAFGNKDIEYCKLKAHRLAKKYKKSKFLIIEGSGEFARAKALDIGMRTLSNDSLVFVCDVDMTVQISFLNRCRKNTIRGEQVYFPEVFKFYNKDYVYKFKKKPRRQHIARNTGHWGHTAYGMLCIYQSDYVATGGFDTKIYGWGSEDVKYHEKVLNADYKTLRAPDPGLSHRWHDKKCYYTDEVRYHNCLQTTADVLGDRRELARYIMEMEEKKWTK